MLVFLNTFIFLKVCLLLSVRIMLFKSLFKTSYIRRNVELYSNNFCHTLFLIYFRLSGGIKDFSTCSLDDFKYFAAHSGLECLRKILPVGPVYKQWKVCGNGKLESGEECDCGTLQVSGNFFKNIFYFPYM